MDKLVDVLCDVDDFCTVFLPEWGKIRLNNGKRKRKRYPRITESEMMTIIISFHQSNHRDFKNFYVGFVARFWKEDFPNLLSYSRSVELMPSVFVPLCSYFSTLKGKPTGIYFIDSTSIKVCHNIRIPRHRVFDGVAKRGKGTMGWL